MVGTGTTSDTTPPWGTTPPWIRDTGAPPHPTRSRGRRIALGVVVVVLALLAAVVWWDLRTDSRTGPDPTVPASASCDGRQPGAVLAVDAATGQIRWSALVGGARSLALADGTLAAVGGGRIRAMRTTDGHARWCREAPKVASVAAAGTTIVVDGPSGLTGHRAANGTAIWRRFGRFDWLTADSRQVVVQQGGRPHPDGRLITRGIDPGTGAQRWSYRSQPTPFVAEIFPLLDEPALDLTYVHSGVGVHAAGPTGVRWEAALFRPIGLAGPDLVGGVALELSLPVLRFALTSLDPTTGAQRWRREVRGSDARLVGGVVVVLGLRPEPPVTLEEASAPDYQSPLPQDSDVVGHRATDGEVLWSAAVPHATQVHQAGGGAVVLWSPGWGTGEPQLIGMRAATGEELWRTDVDNPGASEHYREGDEVLDVEHDPVTGTTFVLVQAQEPHQD
ncbi:MAG TPA: PQQ-binding-like beta-propeller repeat protein [Aquihabitans sp.]|jgi:outer membrane protein assembly factor BamB|nr:PQQ-binding-like beta-propeller repeat protein [Aquihabitans sp.]